VVLNDKGVTYKAAPGVVLNDSMDVLSLYVGPLAVSKIREWVSIVRGASHLLLHNTDPCNKQVCACDDVSHGE
jgi:hypothetical protein